LQKISFCIILKAVASSILDPAADASLTTITEKLAEAAAHAINAAGSTIEQAAKTKKKRSDAASKIISALEDSGKLNFDGIKKGPRATKRSDSYLHDLGARTSNQSQDKI
jgi:hypothetical protein